MITKTKSVIIALSLTFAANHSVQGFFGNKPLSKSCQILFDTAQQQMHTNATSSTMNSLTEKLGLSSFSWFGNTWFSEKAQKQSTDILTFQMYHELYHHKLAHDYKMTTIAALCIALPALILQTTAEKITASLMLATIICSYASRLFEQEADIHAAQILCKNKQHTIVQRYIDTLYSSNSLIENLLFPHPTDLKHKLKLVLHCSQNA